MIAQILQRYFPKDVKMWSYENALRLECRENNWLEMHKSVFPKIGLPMHKSE